MNRKEAQITALKVALALLDKEYRSPTDVLSTIVGESPEEFDFNMYDLDAHDRVYNELYLIMSGLESKLIRKQGYKPD